MSSYLKHFTWPQKESLSIAMKDIDYFKKVNDDWPSSG